MARRKRGLGGGGPATVSYVLDLQEWRRVKFCSHFGVASGTTYASAKYSAATSNVPSDLMAVSSLVHPSPHADLLVNFEILFAGVFSFTYA